MFPPPNKLTAGFAAALSPPNSPPEDAAGVPLEAVAAPKRPPEGGADVLGVEEPVFEPNGPPEAAGVDDAPAAGLAPKRPPPVDVGVPVEAAEVPPPKSPPAGFWPAFCPKSDPLEAGVPLLDPAAGVLLLPRLPKEKLGVPVEAPPKRPPDAGAEVAGVEPLFDVGVAFVFPKLKDIVSKFREAIGVCQAGT